VRAEIVRRVGEIYEWIDARLSGAGRRAGMCSVCGKCCDFAAFGHRLFITSPELLHFTASSTDGIRIMGGGRCPYNVGGKCETYATRFAGCRIFCCGGDAEFQSTLTEAAIEKFKGLCLEYDLPYRYMDLVCALNSAASDTCR
jgi:hypothetical protein